MHIAYQLGHNTLLKFYFCKRKLNISDVIELFILLPSINMLTQPLRGVLPYSCSVVCSKSKRTSKTSFFFCKT